MPLSPSPAPDMLATIRAFLEQEILPGLAGDKWFNLKIAINMLAMVERELLLAPAADAAERARLSDLLGRDGTLDELTRALALAIRDGALAIDDPRLLEHLRRSAEAALAIDNPHWLAR